MTRVQSINLEWHVVQPGILGIGRHAISNSGEIATAFRDSLAARTYCLARYTGGVNGQADVNVGGTFTIESIRSLQALPHGGFALAVTDDDLYFMNTSSVLIERTTYQPGRGMMFVDIALAASDSRRTFAILSMDRSGDNYTVSAAEGGDSLVSLWAKTWMCRVSSVALSADGEWFATGLGNGSVVVMDRSRQIVWEYMPDADDDTRPAVMSLCVDQAGSVVAVDETGEVRRHAAGDGHILWRWSLPETQREGVLLQNAVFNVAADGATKIVAVTSLTYGAPKAGKAVADSGYAVLEGETGHCVWSDKLPSAASGVAVSPDGNSIAVSCRGGDLIAFSARLSLEIGMRSTAHQFALAQAMYDEARAAAEAGQFADAVPLLDEALSLNPTHAGATMLFDDVTWHLRSNTIKSTTDVTEENLAHAEAALKLMPFDERLTIRRNALARLVAEKLSAEATLHEAEEREEEAIQLFLRAVTLDKNNFEVRMALKNVQDKFIRRLVTESQHRMADQDHEGAIELLEKVRSLRPDEPGLEDRLTFSNANLAFVTGMAHYNAKRYPQAAFQFKRTLALQKENLEAARYLRLSEAAARQAPIAVKPPTRRIPDGNGAETNNDDDRTLPAGAATDASNGQPRLAQPHVHRAVSRVRRAFPR